LPIRKYLGEKIMTGNITWEKDLDEALARARAQDMPILLFFHNPD